MTTTQDHKALTEQILDHLRKGVSPWRCPWTVGGEGQKGRLFVPMGVPRNAVTGRHYNGVNMLILWLAKDRHGYEHDLWATEKTWAKVGGTVKPGAQGTNINY